MSALVNILYMWVVAIVMVVAFEGGPIAFQGFVEISKSRSNMKPKSIPKQARKLFEELFCWFQVLRQHFMFLSFCIHLHAYSFHAAFMSSHFPFILLSCSFHLYSCPFIFLSYSFHLHSNVHSCPVIFLSKIYGHGSIAWPGDRVQHMVSFAKLSLRLLPTPNDIWYCSKEICHRNDRVRERER